MYLEEILFNLVTVKRVASKFVTMEGTMRNIYHMLRRKGSEDFKDWEDLSVSLSVESRFFL